MKKTEFCYTSSNGATPIHACLWEPECAPKAVIQIAHGITEHILRYEEFAAYFTARGYVVAGNDHLGHGTSMDARHPLPMYFGPAGSWAYVTADIRACTMELKRRYPHSPLCLLGFSLGSFAVRCLLGEVPELADMTIWAGTGQMKPAEIAIAKAIAKLEARRFGDTGETALLRKLTMDTYNQRFQPCRTGADWLCATAEAVDAYLADPLCGEGFTVGSFRELLRGMETSAKDSHVDKMNPNMPVLLLSGAEDPVGSFGKGIQLVQTQLKKHQFTDVSSEIFENMRHDIFREAGKAAVLDNIHRWLEEKCASF